ncbi:hypothetical protein Q8F55_003472 [Vanrija albida]|uniref:Ubiquitin-like domain-containing protein n=1 Tax=Vanrija albida TaxID=181172 RepID=A0ABR3Q431_9TREE
MSCRAPPPPNAPLPPTLPQVGGDLAGGPSENENQDSNDDTFFLPPTEAEVFAFLEDAVLNSTVPPEEDPEALVPVPLEEGPQLPAVLDVKPAGLAVKQSVDFARIRDPNWWLTAPPRFFQITLKGSKEGTQHYEVPIWVSSATSTVDLLAYLCSNYGYEAQTVRLVHQGQQLTASDTMRSLEVEPEDDIDVFVEMLVPLDASPTLLTMSCELPANTPTALNLDDFPNFPLPLNLDDIPDFSRPLSEAEIEQFLELVVSVENCALEPQDTSPTPVVDVVPAVIDSVLFMAPPAAPGPAPDLNVPAHMDVSPSDPFAHPDPSDLFAQPDISDLFAQPDPSGPVLRPVDFQHLRRPKLRYRPRRGYFKIALSGLDALMNEHEVRVWVEPGVSGFDLKHYLRDSFGYDPALVW